MTLPFRTLATAAFCLGIFCHAAGLNEASLTGRVLGHDGSGIAAQVSIYQVIVHDGMSALQCRCSVSTDAEGNYACPDLPAGKFIVRATMRAGSLRNEHGSTPAAMSEFYPGVTNLQDSEVISIQSGGSGWAEFRPVQARPFPVSGRLVPHAPEAAFTLKAASESYSLDTSLPIHYDGKTGEFRIEGVPSGHYILNADWLVNGSEHVSSMPIDVNDGPTTDITIAPMENVVLSGHVSDEGRHELKTGLRLRRVDGSIPVLHTNIKDGAFSFEPVPAGEYELTLEGSSEMYVASLSVDGKTIEGHRFVLGEGPTQVVDATLGKPTFHLNGFLEPWNTPDSSAEVVAVSEEDGVVYRTYSDERRRFSLMGLPPGTYRLYSWPGKDGVAFRKPDALQAFQAQSTEVSLEQGSPNEEIHLTVISQH